LAQALDQVRGLFIPDDFDAGGENGVSCDDADLAVNC